MEKKNMATRSGQSLALGIFGGFFLKLTDWKRRFENREFLNFCRYFCHFQTEQQGMMNYLCHDRNFFNVLSIQIVLQNYLSFDCYYFDMYCVEQLAWVMPILLLNKWILKHSSLQACMSAYVHMRTHKHTHTQTDKRLYEYSTVLFTLSNISIRDP